MYNYYKINRKHLLRKQNTYNNSDIGKTKRKIYRQKIKNKLFKILGRICCRCGFSDKRALQFDHKKGGGHKEQMRFKSNQKMYLYYSNHPKEAKKKLQTMCANCNWIKRHIRKENRGK